MREITLVRDRRTGLPITSQIFTVPNTGQERLGFHFKYITMLDRWCFDFYIDDDPVMCGRTIVTDANLLAPYGFNVGALFATDIKGLGNQPGLKEMTERTVRLFYLSDQERVNLQEMYDYIYEE